MGCMVLQIPIALIIPIAPISPINQHTSLKKSSKILLFFQKWNILLISRIFAKMQNFQTLKNQLVAKWIIIANYFVGKDIRKKNGIPVQNGLNR